MSAASTASSWRGIAQSSRLAGLPDTVATLMPNPAAVLVTNAAEIGLGRHEIPSSSKS
ncbi:hypothetical protein HNP40_003051 [Mycobacteroides chelonae]|nr:hypothetical protein [Mycobacteroides chelonae]